MVKTFEMNKIFSNEDLYESEKNSLKFELLSQISNRHDIVSLELEDGIIEITKGKLLLNLIIMRTFVNRGIQIKSTDLYLNDLVTKKNLDDYFDNIFKTHKDIDDLSNIFIDVLSELSDLSGEINVVVGNTLSLMDFLKMYRDHQEMRDIINYKFPDNVQYSEVEEKFKSMSKDIINKYNNMPESELYPYVKSETGINAQQLTQGISFIGLKPDIKGEVIEYIIQDNFLTGLTGIPEYLIDSIGTRLALSINYGSVRKSGYLTRKLSLSTMDVIHDHDFVDCGTKHYIEYDVSNKTKLNSIIGSHYYEINIDNSVNYDKLLTVDENSDIVGKVIALRNPVTCAGEEKVCRTCYGSDLSKVNQGKNTGLIAVQMFMDQVTQRLLSAKHLLTTNTVKIDWSEDFLKYFNINLNTIFFKDPDLSIRISESDIIRDEEEEEPTTIKSITVHKNGERVLEYDFPVEIPLEPVIEQMLEANVGKDVVINASDIDPSEPLFSFYVKNNEMTKSVQDIIDLLETNNHLGAETYHDMINYFSDLLIENGFGWLRLVHASMIVRNLIISDETGERLDFSKENLDQYDIIRVSKNILDGPLSKSLSFERINDQFGNPQTYTKSKSSVLDPLFQ